MSRTEDLLTEAVALLRQTNYALRTITAQMLQGGGYRRPDTGSIRDPDEVQFAAGILRDEGGVGMVDGPAPSPFALTRYGEYPEGALLFLLAAGETWPVAAWLDGHWVTLTGAALEDPAF